MPKVIVKFFQDFRELIGTSVAEIEIENPLEFSNFLKLLSERYQKLKPILEDFENKGSAIILINGRTPFSNSLIKGGEEIAILPMVEGG
ncbi:MAG: MoaD/ThiS family protein [Candidatus Methanomethylicaceae archaeon]|nr:MoaD/ThiS family protein [Candidatus Verstraetearchaeota archaeon]